MIPSLPFSYFHTVFNFKNKTTIPNLIDVQDLNLKSFQSCKAQQSMVVKEIYTSKSENVIYRRH